MTFQKTNEMTDSLVVFLIQTHKDMNSQAFLVCLICISFCTSCTNKRQKERKAFEKETTTKATDTCRHKATNRRLDTLCFFPFGKGSDGFIEVISPDTIRLSEEKRITLTLCNRLEQTFTTGQIASFEKSEERGWMPIDFNANPPDGVLVISDAIGYELKPGDSMEISHLLFPDRYGYTTGLYRIRFPVSIANEAKEREITKEFYVIAPQGRSAQSPASSPHR